MSERWKIHCGNALDVLRSMDTHSVDAIVTDPPAGIGFMNAAWDKDKGGRDQWVAWLAEIFTEARRVAKPGAHALVWSLPRTTHWTAYGVENAGWTLRDLCLHLFGTGFPKNHRIDVAIDELNGDERPVVGIHPNPGSTKERQSMGGGWQDEPHLTSAASAAWDGWGTAMKPAVEGWWLGRSPLSEKTVAENVLRWGTSALHIDACRIGYASDGDKAAAAAAAAAAQRACREDPNRSAEWGFRNGEDARESLDVFFAKQNLGRWPSHLLLSHTEACRPIGTKTVRAHPAWSDNRPPSSFTGAETSPVHHANDDGTEEIEVWECAADCPVRMLDEQSGLRTTNGGGSRSDMGFNGASCERTQIARPGDHGGASRFFFCAKASTSERELGLEDFLPRSVNDGRETSIDNPYQRGDTQRKNIHPTVKSVALMRWLVRLITPPNGLVLDLFAGSGTTGIAAMVEGHRFVGVELDEEHARIARARIGFAEKNPRAFEPFAVRAKTKVDARQIDLFGGTKAG